MKLFIFLLWSSLSLSSALLPVFDVIKDETGFDVIITAAGQQLTVSEHWQETDLRFKMSCNAFNWNKEPVWSGCLVECDELILEKCQLRTYVDLSLAGNSALRAISIHLRGQR